MSWWVVYATRTNYHKVALKFIQQNIFSRFGCLRAILSDGGMHFHNYQFHSLFKNYGVYLRVTIPCHPQNRQVEVSDREIKKIIKKTIMHDQKDWSCRLYDVFWAYRMTYKKSLGMSSYRLFFEKASHLSIEIEHTSFLGIKRLNLSLDATKKNHLL